MNNIETTILITSPPFGSIAGKEGVDLALVCAAFEQKVNLVFTDLGVLHLINDQDESAYNDKFHDLQLKALEFYDIEQIYIDAESLQRFNLLLKNCIENVSAIDSKKMREFVHTSEHVVIF